MNLETQKERLIQAISKIENQTWIEQMEQFLKQIEEKNRILNYVKPMRKKTNLDEIKKERNYHHNPKRMKKYFGLWRDDKESIQELLNLLNP